MRLNLQTDGANFGMGGSKTATSTTQSGIKAYAVLFRTDGTITDLVANGTDAGSITALKALTWEKGDLLFGIGDITAITFTGTVQIFFTE
jgi:hypothetical protein